MTGTRTRYVLRSFDRANLTQSISVAAKHAQRTAATTPNTMKRRREFGWSTIISVTCVTCTDFSVFDEFIRFDAASRSALVTHLANPILIFKIPIDGKANALFESD